MFPKNIKTSAKTIWKTAWKFPSEKHETKNFFFLLDEFSDTHRQVIESFLVYISFMHDRFIAQRKEKLHIGKSSRMENYISGFLQENPLQENLLFIKEKVWRKKTNKDENQTWASSRKFSWDSWKFIAKHFTAKHWL